MQKRQSIRTNGRKAPVNMRFLFTLFFIAIILLFEIPEKGGKQWLNKSKV
jgi:hypothetical protein